MDKVATVLRMNNKKLLIELDESVSEEFLELIHRDNQEPIQVEVRFVDPRKITAEQRKLIYCLLRDISNFNGYTLDEYKEIVKLMYQAKTGQYISFRDCERVQASDVIDMLLEVVLRDGVQLSQRYEYLLRDNSFFYKCLKYKACCICGQRQSDIHHAIGSVGMGRNRRFVDHTEYGLECLCRNHHTECHKIGQNTFDKKYHLTPVYLNYSEVERLKLNNKSFIEDLKYHNGESE